VLSLALTFFLVANPIGNSPAMIALVKDCEFSRQKIILLREAIFALLLALFFQYFGEFFLDGLSIKDYAVMASGGLLLFIVALGMIFVNRSSEDSVASTRKEPFFVPIATPIISGPGLLAIIMLKSRLENNNIKITMAILLAWVGVIAVLTTAPYLQKFLGKRGLVALEQIMGLILALMSIDMIVNGTSLFIKSLHS